MKNPHPELTTKNLVQQRPRRPNSNSRTAQTAPWRIEILLLQQRNPLALRLRSEMETMKAEGSQRRRSTNDHNPETNLLEKATHSRESEKPHFRYLWEGDRGRRRRRFQTNSKTSGQKPDIPKIEREHLRKMRLRTQGKAFTKRHKTKG